MASDDFVIENIGILISANKSKDWHDRIVNKYTVLMKFIKDNDLLISVDPFDSEGGLKEDFQLRKSDLTGEGFEFYKKPVQGWLKFVGGGGDFTNVSRLEKGLAELRKKSS